MKGDGIGNPFVNTIDDKTIRALFQCVAMHAILTISPQVQNDTDDTMPEAIANASATIADAMMAERKRREDG